MDLDRTNDNIALTICITNSLYFPASGEDIRFMKFLNTPVLLGVLSGKVENGYNLINSPMYAKEAGFATIFKTDESMKVDNVRNTIEIMVRNEVEPSFSIRGTSDR